MLKRLISISLTFIFLFSVFGFTLNKHFCHGELQEVSIQLLKAEETCCDKPDKMPTNCCHNEEEVLQLDSDYLKTTFEAEFRTWEFQIIHITFLKSLIPDFTISNKFNFKGHSPPILYEDIPILIQSFLL